MLVKLLAMLTSATEYVKWNWSAKKWQTQRKKVKRDEKRVSNFVRIVLAAV